jgi:protein-S-isoprenylcysteine O-methyltransferase Ste14
MSLLLRNLLFTLVVPASVGVYVPLWLARGTPRSPGVVLAVALVPFAIATGIYGWSVWNFAVRGRGTPLPLDAPQRLVIQGPYRYTRNPMYLALFSALLGWLLLYPTTGLAAYAVGVATSVSLFVIVYEEPHLRRLFGAEYDAYKSRVPRWWPRIPRRPGV